MIFTTSSPKEKFFLQGLNELRGIAALVILFSHIDIFAYLFGIEKTGWHKFGDARTVLFFVITGYLSTFLLLREKSKSNSIDLKGYYFKRALRIWPLYYLAIGITLAMIPYSPLIEYSNLKESIFLYIFFMPNISYCVYFFPILAPLWSLGVTEQFALLWAPVVNKTDSVLKALLILIGVYFCVLTGFKIFENGIIYEIIRATALDCIAIGGVGAYLVHSKSKLLNFLYSGKVQIWNYIILIPLVIVAVKVPALFKNELCSVFYIIAIINITSNPDSILKVKSKFFNDIGKISYGIYVYHMLVIYVLAAAMRDFLPTMNWYAAYGIAALSSAALTVLLQSAFFSLMPQLICIEFQVLLYRNFADYIRPVRFHCNKPRQPLLSVSSVLYLNANS